LNGFGNLVNDNIALPKTSKLKGGKIKKENPFDRHHVPFKELFPHYTEGPKKGEIKP
jgi:hypothetical protein